MAQRLKIRVPIEPPSPQAGWPAFSPAKSAVDCIALLQAGPPRGQIQGNRIIRLGGRVPIPNSGSEGRKSYEIGRESDYAFALGQIRVICRERTDRAAWCDLPAVLPVHGDGGPRVTAAPHRPHRGSWPPLPLT